MNNATAVLAVKFQSSYAPQELLAICEKGLKDFRSVTGLIQKYYITENETGSISGIYLFSSNATRDAFWASDVARDIPRKYGVIMDSLRVEKYEIAIILNESAIA